jgi:hypothetical protein
MSNTSVGIEGEYSEIADQQLDNLEERDPTLYNDVLTMCEAIFLTPGRAQSMSAAIQTEHGIIFRLAVPGRHPYKVFWTSSGPRIEAIFPYP